MACAGTASSASCAAAPPSRRRDRDRGVDVACRARCGLSRVARDRRRGARIARGQRHRAPRARSTLASAAPQAPAADAPRCARTPCAEPVQSCPRDFAVSRRRAGLLTRSSGQRARGARIERIGQAERPAARRRPRRSWRHCRCTAPAAAPPARCRASNATRCSTLRIASVGGDAAGGDQRGRRAETLAKQPEAGAQPVGHDIDHGRAGTRRIGRQRPGPTTARSSRLRAAARSSGPTARSRRRACPASAAAARSAPRSPRAASFSTCGPPG